MIFSLLPLCSRSLLYASIATLSFSLSFSLFLFLSLSRTFPLLFTQYIRYDSFTVSWVTQRFFFSSICIPVHVYTRVRVSRVTCSFLLILLLFHTLCSLFFLLLLFLSISIYLSIYLFVSLLRKIDDKN